RMFYEASESNLKHIPDDVFLTMGRRLDCQHVSLAENLDTRGREILKHLGRQGKPIVTWEAALSDKSEREFLTERTTTRAEATVLDSQPLTSRTLGCDWSGRSERRTITFLSQHARGSRPSRKKRITNRRSERGSGGNCEASQ